MPDSPDSMDQSNSTFNYNNFNSRTNLTEKVQISDDYDPFEHRDLGKGNSTSGTLVNLLKGSLGTGILAMPMAFHNGGLIFSLIGTIVGGILCTHCVHILVKTSQQICKEARVPALGYAETAKVVFEYGPKPLHSWSNFAKQFVDFGLMCTHYAVGCVFMVFIATAFHDVLNYEYNLDWDVRIYIAMTLVPCLFIGQIRSLKWLVPFSSAANVFILGTIAITLYYMFKVPLVFTDKPYISSITNIPLFFSTVIFAMEGIGLVLPVANSMKNPQHFLGCPGVLNMAMGTVTILYAIIGFFGYARYGDQVRGSITLNLPAGDPWADAAKLLMGLAALFTFGLHLYVPNEILWPKINHKFNPKNYNRTQIYMRTIVVLISGTIAVAIPNLENFISLVGAIFISLLAVFVPSFVETVYLWPDRLGYCKWKLIKNILICLAAICIMIYGTTTSIEEIIATYA